MSNLKGKTTASKSVNGGLALTLGPGPVWLLPRVIIMSLNPVFVPHHHVHEITLEIASRRLASTPSAQNRQKIPAHTSLVPTENVY